jgi:hypothetical protein
MSWSDDFVAQHAPPQAAPQAAAKPSNPAVPPTLSAPKVQQPTEQPGILSSFGAGLGHGVQQSVLGLQQLLGRGMTAMGSDHVGPWLTQDAEKGIAQGNADYAPYSNAHPIVAGTGNVAGQIAATAPTMLVGPEYAGLSLAGKLGLGAAQGAAGAAVQPVETPGSNFWTQKAEQVGIGGGLGAAGPLVAAGARAAGNGLWNVVQPVIQPERFVGRGMTNMMAPADAATAAANIRNAQQFVPGSVPTTAQVAQTPFMVQTEKAAANNVPAFKTAVAQRGIENNNARWQALMGVAQDQGALDAATQARATATQPLYDAAHSATANIGPGFMKKAQIPEMQEAMANADNLARLQAQTGRGVDAVWPQAPTPGVSGSGSKTINGAALDYTSRALGDMIGNASSAGQTQKAGALSALKDWVDNWSGQYVPGVSQARQTYAQMSVPVNTIGVGQEIANSLGTRAMNSGGVPQIELTPFRSALTKAMNSGDAAKYGIDANALSTLQGIGQDLQRATVSNGIKSPGSDTAYNLAANGWLARNLYGPAFGGATPVGRGIAGLATALAGHPFAGAGVAAGMGKIGQAVGGRLENRLSGLLMNPDAILPYLDARAAASAQSVPNPLVNGLLNYGRPAAVNGLIGGFNNAGNK